MRIPIASALAWPQRMATPCAPLDLASIARLDFEATDEARFPATALCRRSEEHTSELQSLMRISYAVFCLKKKKNQNIHDSKRQTTYERTQTTGHTCMRT